MSSVKGDVSYSGGALEGVSSVEVLCKQNGTFCQYQGGATTAPCEITLKFPCTF